jgi:hypothetical protein
MDPEGTLLYNVPDGSATETIFAVIVVVDG